jgi:hypothetical protein
MPGGSGTASYALTWAEFRSYVAGIIMLRQYYVIYVGFERKATTRILDHHRVRFYLFSQNAT